LFFVGTRSLLHPPYCRPWRPWRPYLVNHRVFFLMADLLFHIPGDARIPVECSLEPIVEEQESHLLRRLSDWQAMFPKT